MYYMMFVQIQNDINWQNQTRDLSNAYLYNADVRFADLSGADLRDADLTGADLSDADLTNVVWYFTTCPDGTNSNDNGNTCENNL